MLTAKRVERIKKKGRYWDGHAGVPGLGLQVGEGGRAKSWLLRYQLNGKTRWMGLGSFPTFSLVEARERARRERQKLADKIDPLVLRRSERAAARQQPPERSRSERRPSSSISCMTTSGEAASTAAR
jgi:hypothetical protein